MYNAAMKSVIFTIGHSVRSIEEFVAMLRAFDVTQIIDVRSVPKSRHNPQYEKNLLATSLRNRHINYAHYNDLGGLRYARKDSTNTGWRNASFRGYADYMQTDSFAEALKKLTKKASTHTTAIMCAEAVPWRCHRSMIADALVHKGFEVRHIMSKTTANKHTRTSFAKIRKGKITYPGTS